MSDTTICTFLAIGLSVDHPIVASLTITALAAGFAIQSAVGGG